MKVFKRFKLKQEYHYARIDQNNRCFSVWSLTYKVDRQDVVEISSMNMFLIGRKWNGRHWLVDGEKDDNPAYD